MKNLFTLSVNSKRISPLMFLLLVAAMSLPFRSHAQSVQGPNSPDSVTYQVPSCLACPGATWSNPDSVKVSDGKYATAELASFPQCNTFSCYYSRGLISTKFGFNIPSNATVTGVRVDVQRLAGAANLIRDSAVYLMENNANIGMNKADTMMWPVVDTYTSYGDSTDLWGATLTSAIVNSATFGLFFKPFDFGIASGFTAADVDYISMSVYYTIPTNITSIFSDINSIATIYPNPLKGFLQIKGINKMKGFVMIEIRNMLGQIVYHIPAGLLSTVSDDSVFLQISWLTPGMYLVQLTSDEDTPVTRKIVKE
jgi:hypothetical protein